MKKILGFLLITWSLFLASGIKVDAAQPTWTYTNFYSTHYGLVSDCIYVNGYEVVTGYFAKSDYATYEKGGIESGFTLYSGDTCSGSDIIDTYSFYDLQPSDRVDSPVYEIDFLNLAPGEYVGSLKVTLVLTLETAFPPSGYVAYMDASSEYILGAAPYSVRYMDQMSIYYEQKFINIVPQTTDPTKTGSTFQYWVDINGDIYDYQLPPTASQINEDGIFYLYSVYQEDYTITLPPELPPSVDDPLDVILFNTGFFNTAGFMLLFFIAIVAFNVAMWYFKIPFFANLIGSIGITAIFMFFGYLPIWAATLMIMMFILITMTINKGGMLNE